MVERAVAELRHRPSGLCTDFDGTLSRIVPSADEARLAPGVREALARLVRQLDVVAVITGRSVEDVRQRVGLGELVYVGNHGLERWESGRHWIDPEALAYVPRLERVARAVSRQARSPGVVVEFKGLTLSVHYRMAERPDEVERTLLPLLEALAAEHGLRLTRGRMVFELRPPVDRDKGVALVSIVERYGLGAVVFLGDDRTDVDAMRRLAHLRESERVRGLAIGVRSDEAPPELVEVADVMIDGVDEVARFLDQLGHSLAT